MAKIDETKIVAIKIRLEKCSVIEDWSSEEENGNKKEL